VWSDGDRLPATRPGIARLLAPDLAVELGDLRQHPGRLEILPMRQLGTHRPVVAEGALRIRDERGSGHATALPRISRAGKGVRRHFPHMPSKYSDAVAG
jgi:hypothetical protein